VVAARLNNRAGSGSAGARPEFTELLQT